MVLIKINCTIHVCKSSITLLTLESVQITPFWVACEVHKIQSIKEEMVYNFKMTNAGTDIRNGKE